MAFNQRIPTNQYMSFEQMLQFTLTPEKQKEAMAVLVAKQAEIDEYLKKAKLAYDESLEADKKAQEARQLLAKEKAEAVAEAAKARSVLDLEQKKLEVYKRDLDNKAAELAAREKVVREAATAAETAKARVLEDKEAFRKLSEKVDAELVSRTAQLDAREAATTERENRVKQAAALFKGV